MSQRRRKSRADALAPALFPFLAVLLCTMGALVVVLVLVVSQASAAAKQSQAATEDKLQELSDFVSVASDEMLAQREQQQKVIESRRSQLAAIEDHIQRSVEELKQLQEIAAALDSQTNLEAQNRQAILDRMALLSQEVVKAQSALEAKRAELAKRPPAFAIVPYGGGNGTSRRPIYLECTASGVVIQPEGVTLSIDDLKPPFGPGNPLDACLRVIRSAYQRQEGNASIYSSPYPLLLVRPDGIKAYSLARLAMSGWDDQFGYELIDGQMQLAFPPTVPGMEPQLVSAIGIARQRQAALIAAMPRRYAMEDWEEMLEEIDSDTGSSGSSRTANSARNANDWASVDQLPGSSSESGGWRLIEESPGITSTYTRGIAGPPHGSASFDGGPIQDLAQDARSATVMERGNSQSASSDLALDSVPSPTDPFGESAATQQMADGNVQPNQPPNNRAMLNQPMNSQAMMNQAITARNDAASQSMPDSSFSPESTSSFDRELKPSNETQNSETSSPTVTIRTPSASPTKETPKPMPNNPRSWTSRRRITNGTPVSRSIPIVVMPDRWFLMQDDRPDQVEKIITLQNGPQAARMKLEEAIDQRVDSWGVAMSSGYWLPRLECQVAPQAEVSMSRLAKLLEDSGLEVQAKPLQ